MHIAGVGGLIFPDGRSLRFAPNSVRCPAVFHRRGLLDFEAIENARVGFAIFVASERADRGGWCVLEFFALILRFFLWFLESKGQR